MIQTSSTKSLITPYKEVTKMLQRSSSVFHQISLHSSHWFSLLSTAPGNPQGAIIHPTFQFQFTCQLFDSNVVDIEKYLMLEVIAINPLESSSGAFDSIGRVPGSSHPPGLFAQGIDWIFFD